jgi:hypothetical protein
MSFLAAIGITIIANTVFWLSLGAAFWAASTVVARRFSKFFGIHRIASVTIYLSNLWTPATNPSRKFEGYTISLHELRAAQAVDKLFGAAPLRLPDLVRGFVDAIWLRHHVRCTTKVCPLQAENASLDSNMIIVGSSKRNTVRARYVRARLPSATLAGEDTDPGSCSNATNILISRIVISRDGNRHEVSLAKMNLAIVEKCHDPERGTVLFFCMGPRADASWAATEYLIRNWRRLFREFGDDDFVICLGFPYTERYLEEYMEPLRLTVRNSKP